MDRSRIMLTNDFLSIMEPEAELGDGYLGTEIGIRRRSLSISDDYSVQKTNDDATECKYIASKLNYFKDAYIHRFILSSECNRRDPEISRGYWARIIAIKAIVDAFLKAFPEKCQIINLGAGFDTLYWRLKEEGKQLYRYVEVDFSSVTAKKIRQIRRPGSPSLISMFSEEPKEVEHSDLHAGDYHLVGADLRQLNEFKEKLESCNLNYKTPTLFIAECVLVYMGTSQSDELLSASVGWFENAFFLNYEQVNISDTFGKVMVSNLYRRGIILPGLAACENLDTQKERFVGNGWKNVFAKTMWEIYGKEIPDMEVKRIEKLELLDEKILLSQLLEHYCFVIASKTGQLEKSCMELANMFLNIEQAEQEFQNLLNRVEPKSVAEFLSWINESFFVSDGKHHTVNESVEFSGKSESTSECDILLRKIAMDIRSELPTIAILPSETMYWPQSGLDSDCNRDTTVHVDAFLYDDDDVDELVDRGTLSREYCAQCGCREIMPLTFISHSLSIDQLRYAFTVLVPLSRGMKGTLIVDVGSRLGAVLYAIYSYSNGLVNAIGIEMNEDFCKLQKKVIEINGMEANIKVINDDVRKQAEVINAADVVVLHNVFSFFLPLTDQTECWEFLRKSTRPGAAIISNPAVEAVTDHLVLSFRISDWLEKVALLGKIDSEWKVWTLDDNGRIEMPLDAEHCETYPVGVSVDVSSVLPVKIEGNVERPSCPTVLALSSQGILLAFNALSFRVEHQSINIQPEDLPSEIYGTVLTRADIIQSEHSCIDAPDRERQTISAPVNSRGSTDSFKSRSISNQNAIPLQMQAKINISQSVQATTASKLHELLPCHKPQRSTDQQQQLSEHLQHQQLKTNASFSSTHLFTELQENLQKKLVIFDKQFFDFCERNDWLQNLRKSSAKQLEWNSGINLDDEMLELEKVRTVVSSWLDALENQMKDSMCSIEEQLGIANSTDRELFDNRRMLDFNSMHRLDKLVGALTKLEQKVANIEDILLEMPTCDTKNRSNLILNIDQEQQIATTAKNICKRIISRRKILYELQQRITNLSIQLKLLKKDQGADKFFASTKSSLSNSSLAYHTSSEELERTVVVSAQQQRELLKFLTQRGPVKQSEAKIVLLDNHSHEADEEISNSISNSTITDIENRLLEAALMPIKTPAKLVMDIGTQSSDYLFFKEAKSYVDMVISTPIISKSFTSSETDKPLTIRSNHFQKIAESDLNSSAAPSSFMNLSSSTAAIPTTSSLFATNAIVKQSPAEKSSKTVPETVALCQVQPSDITFSFKNLDAPSTARNNISSREKTSTIMQKTASIGSAITSESLTNISAAAVSSSTTTTEIDRTSTQNFGTSKTNKEMAIIDSSPTSTTASKTLSAETNVSFTFKLPAAGNQQTASSQADFVSDAINTMIESQSKDFDVLGDDGMMEAEGTSTVPTTLFSSSLSFGLENAISNPNATQNVFGSGLKFLPSAQSQTASLFGNADAGNKNISAFSAAGPTTSNDGRLFSRMQQSNATSTSFSFSSVANPHSSSCLFGTKSTTSVTTFGSTPSFGSKPVFGSPSPLVSAFSQQRFQHTAPTTTAFSNFAKTSTVGFGSLAASQQQQSSVSVFGGSGFGAVAQQPQKNTIFGGGLNSSLTNSSSFSTWR
ncbi:Leucine carboxyl methyltransferase [Dirofilaria immitis]